MIPPCDCTSSRSPSSWHHKGKCVATWFFGLEEVILAVLTSYLVASCVTTRDGSGSGKVQVRRLSAHEPSRASDLCPHAPASKNFHPRPIDIRGYQATRYPRSCTTGSNVTALSLAVLFRPPSCRPTQPAAACPAQLCLPPAVMHRRAERSEGQPSPCLPRRRIETSREGRGACVGGEVGAVRRWLTGRVSSHREDKEGVAAVCLCVRVLGFGIFGLG